MNWKDCVWSNGDRFTLPNGGISGFDCKPYEFTISDVWGAISWFWTWPGDWLLSQEPLVTFFEIEASLSVGSFGSTLFGYFIGLVVLVGIPSAIHDLRKQAKRQ